MKCVVVSYGSRGDTEPCAAVARELLRRGHDVQMAVPASLTDGADALLTGMTEQRLAANVAQYRDIPLVALHFVPAQLQPAAPPYYLARAANSHPR